MSEAIYLIEKRVADLRRRIEQRGPGRGLGDALYQTECELVIAKMTARVWSADEIIKRMRA